MQLIDQKKTKYRIVLQSKMCASESMHQANKNIARLMSHPSLLMPAIVSK